MNQKTGTKPPLNPWLKSLTVTRTELFRSAFRETRARPDRLGFNASLLFRQLKDLDKINQINANSAEFSMICRPLPSQRHTKAAGPPSADQPFVPGEEPRQIDYETTKISDDQVKNLAKQGVLIRSDAQKVRSILGENYPSSFENLSDLQLDRLALGGALKLFANSHGRSARVSTLIATKRPENIDRAIDNVVKQSYPSLEIVLVLHGNSFDEDAIKNKLTGSNLSHKLIAVDGEVSFGEALNKGLEIAEGRYVAKMDDDDDYGQNHIWDLVMAIEQSSAKIVGKWGHFVYLKNTSQVVDFGMNHINRYVGHLSGGTILAETSYLKKLRFANINSAIDSDICSRALAAGDLLYSTHPFNYVRVRAQDHTYGRSEESFIRSSSNRPKADYHLADYEA